MAEAAEVGLLRIVEAATVLTEDGLDACFYFGMAFRRKLGEIGRLLLRGKLAGWIGKTPVKVRGRYFSTLS
jgi:hypothetical protein